MTGTTAEQIRVTCSECTHFADDPVEFERSLPGILILSSGHSDARGNQGICRLHEQMVAPQMFCPRFEPDASPT